MNDLRPLLHEIMNALSIARGLSEGVDSSLIGELELTLEQQREKLARVLKALDRVEVATEKIREIIVASTEG